MLFEEERFTNLPLNLTILEETIFRDEECEKLSNMDMGLNMCYLVIKKMSKLLRHALKRDSNEISHTEIKIDQIDRICLTLIMARNCYQWIDLIILLHCYEDPFLKIKLKSILEDLYSMKRAINLFKLLKKLNYLFKLKDLKKLKLVNELANECCDKYYLEKIVEKVKNDLNECRYISIEGSADLFSIRSTIYFYAIRLKFICNTNITLSSNFYRESFRMLNE